MLVSLGKITVVSAGTPVALSAGVTVNVNTLFIQAINTNTGLTYVGLASMVRGTFSNVLRVIGKPSTTGNIPDWTVGSFVSVSAIDLKALFIDSDVSGEGVLVSYLAA